MRTAGRVALWASSLIVVALWIAACSDDEVDPLTPTGAGGQAAHGAGGSATGTGGDGIGGLNIGGQTTCSAACSADLKEVLDCAGNVTQTCTGDQACLNGECSDDPCGAAEASKSSYGCDYFALRPDVITEVQGACYAVFVANTWSVPVHIDVSYQGQAVVSSEFIQIPQGQGQSLTYTPYDPVAGLPVGEVAVVFLAHDTSATGLHCPFAAAVDGTVGVDGTGFGDAFSISTDRPIVAYSILPFGGGSAQATSASLLLPISAWDTNYIAVNAYPKSQTYGPGQPSLDIVAHQDDTEVTILPPVAVVGGGGIAATPAGQPIIYQLDAGEYLQIAQNEELTGAPIQSNKPIGVFGGANCLNVPVDVEYCDSAHQQIPPVRALGSEYAGVRYRNRASAGGSQEAPPWRLVGAVNGTQLSWEPSTPAGAPASIDLGQVIEFAATGPFVVKSQDEDHPFYFAQYMTGSEQLGSNEGDPEWVNVVPVMQYIDYYVFFTDPTYSETNLVVVRRKSPLTDAFADVTLDCLGGALTGWQPLGDHEYTHLDLVTGDFEDVGSCSNGRHLMTSDAPFGVTVWGWGTLGVVPSTRDVSYAYPAGASVQVINEVVVPPVPN